MLKERKSKSHVLNQTLFSSASFHLPHSRFGRLLLHYITQNETTVSRNPLDEGSACRRDLHLTTHNKHKRQTFMSTVGFEPAIPAIERQQTLAFDREVIGVSFIKHTEMNNTCGRRYGSTQSLLDNWFHIVTALTQEKGVLGESSVPRNPLGRLGGPRHKKPGGTQNNSGSHPAFCVMNTGSCFSGCKAVCRIIILQQPLHVGSISTKCGAQSFIVCRLLIQI
jgi:hypothetical protein